jgi:predicted nucleic acid-binding protein
MPVLLDTGVVYAYYDRSDGWHRRAVAVIHAEADGLILPAPVIPEIDHLLGHRLGAKARQVFYRGLSGGEYLVADLPHERYARVAEIDRQFADLNLGFVDAAVVAIAETSGVRRIATTDRRHFGPIAAALALELLPA